MISRVAFTRPQAHGLDMVRWLADDFSFLSLDHGRLGLFMGIVGSDCIRSVAGVDAAVCKRV
jgi:hypothetical protein